MKRLLDFVFSLLAIILLSPLFLVTALAILISDGVPVIYRQKRLGMGEKKFVIFKFRTMKRGTRLAATSKLRESDRQMIRGGGFLRKISLDELPQLFNILIGDMSFIGPRPLIAEEEEIRELRREYNVYSVRPGLTGLAQVNGRDKLTDAEKAAFDKEYVENASLALDVKIMVKTVLKVLGMCDVYEGSERR